MHHFYSISLNSRISTPVILNVFLDFPFGMQYAGWGVMTEFTNIPDDSFYIQWHITERCDRKCTHCYQNEYASRRELSSNELLLAWKKIESAVSGWNKTLSVSITGGEPLLRYRDGVIPLLQAFEDSKLVDRVDLLSNGGMIQDDLCRSLVKFSNLRRVQVSLESANSTINDSIRGIGAFEQTIRAIRTLKDNGITVAVMMTISKLNLDQLLPTLELCAELGVDTFALERFMPLGQGIIGGIEVLDSGDVHNAFNSAYKWSLKNATPRVLLYRPLCSMLAPEDPHIGGMCSVGTNALTIMHDGTILPCRRLPLPLGNVLTDNLNYIWYESPILWQARNPKALRGKCATCEFVPACRGCRAMALAMTGDWLESDPHCWRPEVDKDQSTSAKLRDDVRLVHPQGTNIFFAYHTDTGFVTELDEKSYWLLSNLDGTTDPFSHSKKLVEFSEPSVRIILDLANNAGLLMDG